MGSSFWPLYNAQKYKLKNAFKKHPLQNRTNVQIKGGGSKAFWTMFKKLHFFERSASLTWTVISQTRAKITEDSLPFEEENAFKFQLCSGLCGLWDSRSASICQLFWQYSSVLYESNNYFDNTLQFYIRCLSWQWKFVFPDKFVIGYALDYNEYFR